MDRYKVFLSSAQFSDEFKAEREALPVVFDKQPLRNKFLLWRIEDYASSHSVDDYYLENVRDADLVILLIGKHYREPVYKEFAEARKNGIQVFCFLKHVGNRDTKANSFVDEVRKDYTTADYHEFSQLTKKIEDSLAGYFYSREKSKMTQDTITKEKSSSDKTERALRILVGVFDSGHKEQIVSIVVGKYVQYVLKDHSDGLTSGEIQEQIELLFPRVKFAPGKKLEKYLDEMISGHVLVLQNEKYKLIEFDSNLENESSGEPTKILKKIYQSNQNDLSCTQEDFIHKLETCVSQVIYRSALDCSNAIVLGESSDNADQQEDIASIISHEISIVIDDVENVASFEKIVFEVITSNDPQLISWLNQIFKSYWILALLNLDPEIVEEQFEAYKKYVIYLDSHIVLRAMIGAGSEYDLCSELIALCNDLGVEMRLSYNLYIEIQKAFESTNDLFKQANNDASRAVELFRKLEKKSDIFEGFLHEKTLNKHIQWNAYLNKFYSPIKRNRLRNHIEEEFNIKVLDQKDYSEGEWGKIEETKELLLKYRNSLPDNLENEDLWKFDRELILRTNEARQMAIIYNDRENDSSRDYWFVTFDRFIYRASVEISKRYKDEFSSPCHLRPEKILEVLTQIPNRKIGTNVFRTILTSDSVHTIASSIESEVISAMLSSRIDTSVRSVKTLREMYLDILNRPIVQDAYEKTDEAESQEEAIEAARMLRDSVVEVLTKKIYGLEETVTRNESTIIEERRKSEKQRKRAKYYKSQLSRRSKERAKKKRRK